MSALTAGGGRRVTAATGNVVWWATQRADCTCSLLCDAGVTTYI